MSTREMALNIVNMMSEELMPFGSHSRLFRK